MLAQREVGGVVVITTGGNANDFASCQMNGEAWAVTALKDIFFEIRMKVSLHTSTRWFVGLASTDVAGATIGPIMDSVGSENSMIGFIQDGDTDVDIDFLCQNGGTATQTDSGINIAADTFVLLAFHVKGNGSVEYFINGTSVGSSTTNVPDGDAVTLSMEVHAPVASSTLEVDYIGCSSPR